MIILRLFHLTPVNIVQYRGLYATETEIIHGVSHVCPRKINGIWISFFGKFIDLRAARDNPDQ